jgi:ubiquinone/menaquinone biosynthesis C-methylase UbiE
MSERLTLSAVSDAMVKEARAVLGDKAEYVVADVKDLPLAGGSFEQH